jgi:hypothetical protein
LTVGSDTSDEILSYLCQADAHPGDLIFTGLPPVGLHMDALVTLTGNLIFYVQGRESVAGAILQGLQTIHGSLTFHYGGMRGTTEHRPFVLPSLTRVDDVITFENYKAGTLPGDAVLPSLTSAGAIVYAGGSYSIGQGGSSTPFPRLATVDKDVTLSDLQPGTCIGGLDRAKSYPWHMLS